MSVVIENYCDFDHVNHVHKRCYKYCKVISKKKNFTSLEYGVYHIPPLPFVRHYQMEHRFIPPNRIVHYSKRKGDEESVNVQILFKEEGTSITTIKQVHHFKLPIVLKPFEKIIKYLVQRWSNILWEEDLDVMQDRHEYIQMGGKDGLHCGRWVTKNKNTKWEFYTKK